MSLGLAIALFTVGLYALFSPSGTTEETRTHRYVSTGLGHLPLWLFRLLGLASMVMAGGSAYFLLVRR